MITSRLHVNRKSIIIFELAHWILHADDLPKQTVLAPQNLRIQWRFHEVLFSPRCHLCIHFVTFVAMPTVNTIIVGYRSASRRQMAINNGFHASETKADSHASKWSTNSKRNRRLCPVPCTQHLSTIMNCYILRVQ